MQKFTRALTREIEVGGERLAVTFNEEGLSIRPVGSRQPPRLLRWDACAVACVRSSGSEPPAAEEVEAAVKVLKGVDRPRSRRSPAAAPATDPAEQEASPAKGAKPAHAAAAAGSAGEGGANGSSLSALLGRLDRWLAAHRGKFHHGLQPGASPADLEALQAALGRPVPDDLRTWLSWHNGQDPNVFGALEESWHPMSAAEIADAKKELDEGAHEGWQRDWVPFLDDDNGDYLCLDLGRPGTPVRECWRGRAEHAVVAPSLAGWVEHFLTGLEQGAYAEDPERGVLHRH
jgi:cell wall assembly regulator SMI1